MRGRFWLLGWGAMVQRTQTSKYSSEMPARSASAAPARMVYSHSAMSGSEGPPGSEQLCGLSWNDRHSQSPTPSSRPSRMYCWRRPSADSRAASAKGGRQESSVQQVRGPWQPVRLGQSQLACGPRHIESPSGAMEGVGGCELFRPLSTPATRPLTGRRGCSARSTVTVHEPGAEAATSSATSAIVAPVPPTAQLPFDLRQAQNSTCSRKKSSFHDSLRGSRVAYRTILIGTGTPH